MLVLGTPPHLPVLIPPPPPTPSPSQSSFPPSPARPRPPASPNPIAPLARPTSPPLPPPSPPSPPPHQNKSAPPFARPRPSTLAPRVPTRHPRWLPLPLLDLALHALLCDQAILSVTTIIVAAFPSSLPPSDAPHLESLAVANRPNHGPDHLSHALACESLRELEHVHPLLLSDIAGHLWALTQAEQTHAAPDTPPSVAGPPPMLPSWPSPSSSPPPPPFSFAPHPPPSPRLQPAGPASVVDPHHHLLPDLRILLLSARHLVAPLFA